MAVKLRLRRIGRTHYPLYQIIAIDSRARRDGRFLELIGTYDPHKKFDGVKIEHESTLKWLKNGAQPTETVKSILSKEGILLKFHLFRQGKSDDEINSSFDTWSQQNLAKVQSQKDAFDEELRKKAESNLAHEKEVRSKKEAAIKAKVMQGSKSANSDSDGE